MWNHEHISRDLFVVDLSHDSVGVGLTEIANKRPLQWDVQFSHFSDDSVNDT
jgi:hypothetical protein